MPKKTIKKAAPLAASVAKRARVTAVAARSHATATAQVASKHTRLDGFLDFVRSHGVVALAIGIVIGTQVKQLTDQLVISFISPLLGLLLPGTGSLAEKSFSISIGTNTQTFSYGAFVAVLISFIAVAAIIYYIIKGLGLDKIDKKKE